MTAAPPDSPSASGPTPESAFDAEATPARLDSRRVRAAAVMALYQFDQTAARPAAAASSEAATAAAAPLDPAEAVRAILAQDELEALAPSEAEAVAGASLAAEVHARVAEADAALGPLSPAWPVHRQPLVDRNILRLAWHEITSGRTKPAIAISEAVELARIFGSDRAPAFVNGVLGGFMKGRDADRPAAAP